MVGGSGAHRTRRPPPRARVGRPGRGPLAVRTAPPAAAGRWFALPEVEIDPTRRAHAQAELLLDRHGVVTRGAVQAEGTPGGFAASYKVLSAFEESGRCRRGYFVEGLGAAQFGTAGAIDRLRSFSTAPSEEEPPVAVVLAATDPANPFGAALGWPDREGHRPGRKAGALVVLVDGELDLYVERGGKTMLTFCEGPALAAALTTLAATVRRGHVGGLTIEKSDGVSILSPEREELREQLEAAGFVTTTRGLRLRT